MLFVVIDVVCYFLLLHLLLIIYITFIVCLNCTAGTYTNSQNTTLCTPCPAGRFQPGNGSTNCIDCPAGRFVNIPGTTVCLICAAGSYSPGGFCYFFVLIMIILNFS